MSPLPSTSRVFKREDPETHTPDDPPSPTSYFVPLIIVVLACAGYVFWRRRKNGSTGTFGLRDFTSGPAAVRLSTDEGPSSHSFIPSNDSTDSLPTHALSDIPVLPESLRSTHPARQSQSSSPVPSYSSSGMPSIGLSAGKARRSTRRNGPIEGGFGESDSESEEDVRTGKKVEELFEIGDEEDEGGLSPGRDRR